MNPISIGNFEEFEAYLGKELVPPTILKSLKHKSIVLLRLP